MLNFIVNAHSGKGKGQKTLKKIINYCYKNNLEYTVHLTSAAGHATRIARALCENGSHTLVAVGGDGTFHEVLNGIISPDTTSLGFIPSGRGNDFARCVGIPLNPVKALKIIAKGQDRFIDYIKVGDKRCLNTAGTGLDVDVLLRVAGRHGKLTYLKSLVHCLRKFEAHQITVETEDGKSTEYDCVVMGVCNGRQIGGGIKISPQSDVADGLFNVVIVSMPQNQKIFRLLPKFLRGKHLGLDITTHFVAKSAKIQIKNPYPIQIDGEIYDGLDFDCSIVKGGLKTF